MAPSGFKLFSLVVLLATCFSYTVSSHVSPNLSLGKQASILLSLKQRFESPLPPQLQRSWNASNYMSLCSWIGVLCDLTSKSVISLDLSNCNISGSLSPSISQLRTLVNLTLSGNNFSGIFPPQIHNLPRLKFLNISNNHFSGQLEYWDFSRLNELRVLDAYDNEFNGSLPEGVSQLPNLNYLNLGGNYFTGKIPPSYGSMVHLIYLSLAGNDLSGFIPSELGNLTNLHQLYLGYYNDFDAGIPPQLGKLVNLFHLDLASCGLEGPIPPELGNLNRLDTLFLQANQLTGSLPPQLGNLTSLISLDISINELTGEIPVEFSGLWNLSLLNIFMNKFHGEIPRSLSDLPKLEVLNLWQNNFTGAIPSKLGQNGKLTELDLSTNKLTGSIPKSLCYGRRLKILILLNNFLFGPLPDDLGHCETLVRVRMGDNYLTGSIPNGLLYLPELSLMELHSNYLSGSLQQEILVNETSKLGTLDLSNNRLSGPLPTCIGNFLSLQTLLLSGNQFTGQIPSQIGGLKNVLKMDMSRNNFSGPIPPEISHCVSLTYIDLSQNKLSGPIPIQIAQIHILNYMNVSRNYLNESLPKEIGSMKSLTSADFSHNNLSGSIPETGQYSFFNSTAFIGNTQLCGLFLSPCNQSYVSPDHSRNAGSKSRVTGRYKLVFAMGLLICSLIFAALAIIQTRRSRRKSNSWKLTAFQKLAFGREDILECIKDNNVIGKGGAGIVYKGTMPNGEHVAIKKLFGINKGSSSHDDNGFSAEIQTLGKIRHRNIVRLLAFCSNKVTNLLVYEYMPNGSLGEMIHGKQGAHLKWETRLKIAIEAAKGLCYLHHDCSPLIIHRDVKSNNILLNSEYEAHVADFGLAKFLRGTGTSECMSAIAGSYGYIAPEYAYTLKVDEKSDVYSFGVVLLELITGRRPVGDFGEEGLDIVQWTKIETKSSKERVVKILDRRLISNNDIPIDEAKQVFFVAMLCVEELSVERPTMREVVQMLAQAQHYNTFHMQ